MNVDTDTQYAFTRPIVDHMFANYQGALKVDGDTWNAIDPDRAADFMARVRKVRGQ